jgi:hypothetical protein
LIAALTLYEVVRLELDLDLARQTVTQRLFFQGPQTGNGLRTPRLRKHREPFALRVPAEALPVGLRERFQMANDHGRPRIPGRHLDLWDVARSSELTDEGAQTEQVPADARVQHLAGAKLRDPLAAPLREPDQHPALLLDEPDAEASSAPISPGLGGDGLEPARRAEAADVRELRHQQALFMTQLGLGCQVLQAAAAAQPEVCATRGHTLGRRHQERRGHTLVVAAAALEVAKCDPFPGQGAVDEDGLAYHPRHTASLRGQRIYAGLWRGGGCCDRHGSGAHACGRIPVVWRRGGRRERHG